MHRQRSRIGLLGLSSVPAVVLAAGMAGLLVYILANPTSFWRGDWFSAVHSVGQVALLAAIPLAAAAGWVAGSDSSGVRFDALQLPPRPLTTALVRWAWLWLPAAAVYLTAIGVAVAITLVYGGAVSSNVLPILTCVLGLMFAAAVGLFAGRYLPSLFAAFTAALVTSALVLAPSGLLGFAPLSGPAPSSPYEGTTPDVGHYLVSVALLGFLTVVLMVRQRTSRSWPAPAPLAVLALMVGVTIGCGIVGPTQEYKITGEAPDRCTEATITICVYPGYDRSVIGVVGVTDRILATADRNGLPRELFAQRLNQHGFDDKTTPSGVGEIYSFWWDPTAEESVVQIVDGMIRPIDCPNGNDAAMEAAPPYLEEMYNSIYWLTSQAGYMPEEELEFSLSPQVFALSASEQRDHVEAVLTRLASCDL